MDKFQEEARKILVSIFVDGVFEPDKMSVEEALEQLSQAYKTSCLKMLNDLEKKAENRPIVTVDLVGDTMIEGMDTPAVPVEVIQQLRTKLINE